MKTTFTNALEKTTSDAVIKSDGAALNAKPDGHQKFCKRCFKHNGKCLSTGSRRVDSECRV